LKDVPGTTTDVLQARLDIQAGLTVSSGTSLKLFRTVAPYHVNILELNGTEHLRRLGYGCLQVMACEPLNRQVA